VAFWPFDFVIVVISYLSVVGVTFGVSQLPGAEDYGVCQTSLRDPSTDLRSGVAGMRKCVLV
jgi:hypothetical protein